MANIKMRLSITNPKIHSAIYLSHKNKDEDTGEKSISLARGLEPATFRLEVSVDTVRQLSSLTNLKTIKLTTRYHCASRASSSPCLFLLEFISLFAAALDSIAHC